MDFSKTTNLIDQPKTKWLKDYAPTPFSIDTVNLTINLFENETLINNVMLLSRNAKSVSNEDDTLVLNGESLEFISLTINGHALANDNSAFQVADNGLVIHRFSQYLDANKEHGNSAVVNIKNRIHPEKNTSLSGIYTSSGNFCSQCEAEGFRRITYFLDRPDIMSVYTVEVIADAKKYPILLSNGNPVSKKTLADNRHSATWHDPHPKPCYLFALVAGNFSRIEDSFTTMSGREVSLIIYSEPHNIDQCHYAMGALQRSMEWDEKTYNREYDLDLYMIVAVDDFNAGAMENKGLNVFNTKYVLASPDTATDKDYIDVESVIAHEYFHNWSGNRVTCRDWFQLSLKEGFTVFRDQCFTADLHSAGVKRIDDVNVLRSHQFKEDAGPMAHPIRPESYQEINNFYTVTVYNKGAEIIRMIRHLIGETDFHKGAELFFQRHDNNAVTCEDFIDAMQDASGKELTQFQRWYNQAGTPRVRVEEAYNIAEKTLTLTLSQACPATPGQPEKLPFVIPIKFALFNDKGEQLDSRDSDYGNTLVLNQTTQSFVFKDIGAKPYVSLLRDFSAPVYLHRDIDNNYYSFLARFAGDEFSRWDAMQSMYASTIFAIEKAINKNADTADQTLATATVSPSALEQHFLPLYQSISDILEDRESNGLFIDTLLNIPSITYLGELAETINPATLIAARETLIKNIALAFEELLSIRYKEINTQRLNEKTPQSMTAQSMANRALKNALLRILNALDNEASYALCSQQLDKADNLTDRISALSAISNSNHPERQHLLDTFQTKWQNYPLIMDKWLALQAHSSHKDTLQAVDALSHHKVFNVKNPNKVYSLIVAFAASNSIHFHDPEGKGYQWVAQWVIKVNDINPQVAARIASAFNSWRKYSPDLQAQMKLALERIQAHPNLSKNVEEIVNKALL